MKLIILQNKLKQGLTIVERIAGKNFSLPILSNVLLRAEKNFLTLETTDLEIGIKYWALAQVEKPGLITVPVSVFSNLVRLLPEKPLNLTADGQTLHLETNNHKTDIKGVSADEFPIIPQEKNATIFSLPASSLCQALEQIADIAISSPARPEIAGILFLIQDRILKLVATDSFRLAEKTLTLPRGSGGGEPSSFILPQKTSREIINIFGSKDSNVRGTPPSDQNEIKIYLGPNQVLFESMMAETDHPQVNLVSRLIEGEYPNYQEIIPGKHETQLVLDRSEFLRQIKLASLFCGKISEIKLKINRKKEALEIFSQNTDFGQFNSTLPCQITGKEKELSFNYRFLHDGLSKIKSSEVIIELSERNGEAGPGVLKPVGDSSYIYVLMPMQTS